MNIFNFFRKKETSRHVDFTALIFTSAIIGLCGGITGAIFVDAYLLPPVAPTATTGPISIARYQVSDGSAPSADSVSNSVVAFYASATPSAAVNYTASNLVAGGAVLTGGGWLMTVENPNRRLIKGESVAVIRQKAYPITMVSRDSYSGISFVRVSGAENLPSVWIDASADIAPGSQLFAFGESTQPRRIDVLGADSRRVTEGSTLSSEKLQHIIRLAPVAGLATGAVLVDRRGAVVAIYAGSDAQGSFAIHGAAFYGRLDDVFRNQGQVSRPLLGVRYVDLSKAIYPVGGTDRTRGARLVVGADGARAVIPGSPAALAGLKTGDVIVAVDEEELTAERGLADVIAEYPPDTEIKLTVERGESPDASGRWPTVEVSLKLGKQ